MMRLTEIKGRRTRITKGQWRDEITEEGWLQVANARGSAICGFGDLEETEGEDHANAEFVAHAPDDIDWLIQQIEVEWLDQPDGTGFWWYKESDGYVLVVRVWEGVDVLYADEFASAHPHLVKDLAGKWARLRKPEV